MPTPVEIYVNADRSLSGEWFPTESPLPLFRGSCCPLGPGRAAAGSLPPLSLAGNGHAGIWGNKDINLAPAINKGWPGPADGELAPHGPFIYLLLLFGPHSAGFLKAEPSFCCIYLGKRWESFCGAGSRAISPPWSPCPGTPHCHPMGMGMAPVRCTAVF